MTGSPPVPASEPHARRDTEHLKLLALFHFILAALGLTRETVRKIYEVSGGGSSGTG